MLAEWQVGQVLWTAIWFTLFFVWIWLVIRVFADIFRSHDLSGVAKALWVLFVIVMPYLGVLAYLIVRGPGMAERDVQAFKAHEAAARAYIRDAARDTGSANSPADDLERLAALRDRGVIDDEEFRSIKARILA